MKALIFSLLVTGICFANIRVGKTGGGLAEMKAYSVVQQLPSIIKICSAYGCGLTSDQKLELQKLNSTLQLEKLELVAPFSGPSNYYNQVLKLNSFDLYDGNIPKSYGEILGVVMSVLIRDGLRTNAIWPLQVFSNFHESRNTLDISNYGFKLHNFALGQKNVGLVQAIGLEKDKETEDLTPLLIKSTECVNPIWNLEGWNYSAPQSWVRAPISWKCGPQEWKGELQILLNQTGVVRLGIVRRMQTK